MKSPFSENAWDDYLYWQKTDKAMVKRINAGINGLIHDIQRSPYDGIGKPEPLKHALSGFSSRRINDENRLVYAVESNVLRIAQARYHY